MKCCPKKKLECLLKEISLMQVELLDGYNPVDQNAICRKQKEAFKLGVDIAMSQIFEGAFKA